MNTQNELVKMEAFNQWATRPADQRFQSLEELQASVSSRRMRSRGMEIDTAKIHVAHDERGLIVNGGITASSPSHWSFGQFCSWIGAPASFMRDKMSSAPELLTGTLNHCVQSAKTDALKWLLVEPETDNGPTVLQAVTSPTYGRIWDADVVSAVQRIKERSEGHWHNPLAWTPGHFGDKSKALPGGLYASDRDVFAFMIDGGSILEAPDGKELHRGFIVSNSEVGNATFTLEMFLFRACCGNNIIWGARDVQRVVIRHTKGGPARFDSDAYPSLLAYAQRAAADDESAIRKAHNMLLPEKREDLPTFLAKAAKFSNREIENATLMAKAEEGDCRNVWQMVQGFTAYARTFDYVDARVDLEKRAGKLIDLANA